MALKGMRDANLGDVCAALAAARSHILGLR